MGWWPLRIGTGGIAWGEPRDDTEKIEVVVGGKTLTEDDLAWGDGPADIVDGWIDEHIKELYDKCNDEFITYMGREMSPFELLHGLAFGCRGADPDFDGPIPTCDTHELLVRVIPRED